MIKDEDVATVFAQLSSNEKHQFLLLRENGSTLFTRMLSAFDVNSFGGRERLGPRWYIHLFSWFNYSCLPNSSIQAPRPTANWTMLAMKDIKPVEDITFRYYPNFEYVTSDRHNRLPGFQCTCKACLPGTAFHQFSDIGRTLHRGLRCLIIGEGLEQGVAGNNLALASPIIFDHGLRKQAQAGGLRLSAKFIYLILSGALLEQEGILGDYFVKMNMQLFQEPQGFRVEYGLKNWAHQILREIMFL